MAFSPELAQAVDGYARSDLPGDLSWHIGQFSFLSDDPALQQRVGEEFFTARYIYKILEGLQPTEQWAMAAQVRLQVLLYASIYEACLHHMLFAKLAERPEVTSLLIYSTLKIYSVPERLEEKLQHDGKEIVPAFYAKQKTSDSKVRFEDKADAAVTLGLIEERLGDDLKQLYEDRNSIHLHAELKKHPAWSLETGRLAYRRMKPFCEQLTVFNNKLNRAV